jgi:hypothetical protein
VTTTLLTHLARQALQLIDIGVSESFLIRALRDRLTESIDGSSDVGSTNRKRAKMLEEIGEELSPSSVASLNRWKQMRKQLTRSPRSLGG